MDNLLIPCSGYRRNTSFTHTKGNTGSEGVQFSPNSYHYLSVYESVCTENVNVFRRLFPYQKIEGRLVGLAQLLDGLNGHRIFGSFFQSFRIHFRQMGKTYAVSISATVVQPWTSETADLRYVFGNGLYSFPASPWSSESSVTIELEQEEEDVREWISMKSQEPCAVKGTRLLRFCVLPTPKEGFGIRFTKPAKERQLNRRRRRQRRLKVERYLKGKGLSHGSIETKMFNPTNSPLSLIYRESYPWFVRIYVHSLKKSSDNAISIYDYKPARIRHHQNGLLTLKLVINPLESLNFSVNFDRMLMRWNEYQPDADKGFDLESAVVDLDNDEQNSHRIYTDSIYFALPTPDFSMPYNALGIGATVVGMFITSILNVTCRSLVACDLKDDKSRLRRFLEFAWKRKWRKEKKE
ncbi:hypothetical protein ACOME3_006107 [Neoechinorhynchus agilis]